MLMHPVMDIEFVEEDVKLVFRISSMVLLTDDDLLVWLRICSSEAAEEESCSVIKDGSELELDNNSETVWHSCTSLQAVWPSCFNSNLMQKTQ